MNHAQLAWGTAKLGITNSKILVSNTTDTLNGLLQDLITQVKTLSEQCSQIKVTAVSGGYGMSGPPDNASDIAAVGTELGTIAGKLSALLE